MPGDRASTRVRGCLQQIVERLTTMETSLESHAGVLNRFIDDESRRQRRLQEAIGVLHKRVTDMVWRFNAMVIAGLCTVILTLLGIIGWLLVYGPPWLSAS